MEKCNFFEFRRLLIATKHGDEYEHIYLDVQANMNVLGKHCTYVKL